MRTLLTLALAVLCILQARMIRQQRIVFSFFVYAIENQYAKQCDTHFINPRCAVPRKIQNSLDGTLIIREH